MGARVERLLDGTVIGLLAGSGSATDQSALAARCALRVNQLLPSTPVVLITGRVEDTGRLPVGEVLERAAGLLERARASAGSENSGQDIHVDEITATLLDARFLLVKNDRGYSLRGQRPVGDVARTFLGKPSTFVGRDRELRNVVDLLEEGFGERQANAVLITGVAGLGKSRLGHEVLRKLRERRPELGMGIGRGEIVGAGSAFALLGGAIRSSFGIEVGEPIDVQRDKLSFTVQLFFKGDEVQRIAEFLGELIGAHFPEEKSPRLVAARQNPQIMAERIQQAFVDFTRAIVQTQPILVMLEDLHWGDLPSVKILDAALRELREYPFAVIALARPEVHERFPKLWVDRQLTEIRLAPLSRRIAETLIRDAIGNHVAATNIAALVDRAAGNAFFLEELARALADGRGDSMPETILGMVEARLSALEPEARRLLRAASIFGETFWQDGVRTLLGATVPLGNKDLFADLCEREILVQRVDRRFVGEQEYGFQHALVREGAYAMLTERDREVGHRLAAEWLEKDGEQDNAVLAEHYERGGDSSRAVAFYIAAAENALRGGDFGAAERLCERGITCGADKEAHAFLLALTSDVHFWNGRYTTAREHALGALAIATAGSNGHSRALANAALSAAILNDSAGIASLLGDLLSVEPTRDGMTAIASALHAVIMGLCLFDRADMARAYADRLEHLMSSVIGENPSATAWLEMVRRLMRGLMVGDPWLAVRHGREAIRQFEIAGDQNYLPYAYASAVLDLAFTGAFDEADTTYRKALAIPTISEVNSVLARYHYAQRLMIQNRVEEAQTIIHELQALGTDRNDMFALGLRLSSVECRLLLDQFDGAEQSLRLSVETWSMNRPLLAAFLSRVYVRQSRFEEAISWAREAHDKWRTTFWGVATTQPLVLVDALAASGNMDEARSALREVYDTLRTRGERIEDASYRRGFFEDIPAHARIVALAKEWLGDEFTVPIT